MMAMLACVTAFSQTYTIDFAATGASGSLDSVYVENLNLATDVTWYPGDVLNLLVTNSRNTELPSAAGLVVAPNPLDGRGVLSFLSAHNTAVRITILDLGGKVLLNTTTGVIAGKQRFLIEGLKQGVYIVSVSSEYFKHSVRVVSLNQGEGSVRLQHLGNNPGEIQSISVKRLLTTLSMAYKSGDTIRFTAYAGVMTDTQLDVPSSSKLITFVFTAKLPMVITHAVTPFAGGIAQAGGNVVSDGGAAVTQRGLCWSIQPNPVITGPSASAGSGTGSFANAISELLGLTTYYVRAYAKNSVGTAYGNEVVFTSLSGLPTLIDDTVYNISGTTFRYMARVSSNGGSPLLGRGICRAYQPNPDISYMTQADGSDTGVYRGIVNQLSFNQQQYVRMYATNSFGTTYGKNIQVITTAPFVFDPDSNGYDTVHIGNQIWMRGNLKTTKYRDSTSITLATGNWNSLTYPAYGWYNNNSYNKNLYGALYNGFATVSTSICPANWRVASKADWMEMRDYLIANGYNYDGSTSGNKVAKAVAARNSWASNSPTGSPGSNNYHAMMNASGFSAIPAGNYIGGYFSSSINEAKWWTSDVEWSNAAANFELSSTGVQLTDNWYDRSNALSVRCILATPKVTTANVSGITGNSAQCGGNVLSDGGEAVTARGVCWSTSPNPTVVDPHTTNGIGQGAFVSQISGLSSGLTYYVRAYATNSAGTSYGSQVLFTAL